MCSNKISNAMRRDVILVIEAEDELREDTITVIRAIPKPPDNIFVSMSSKQLDRYNRNLDQKMEALMEGDY